MLQNVDASRTSARRGHALEHALQGITQALERDLFAEDLGQRSGAFQALDARAKVIAILALLISVGMSRNLAVIAVVYALVLILGVLSAIPVDLLLRRVWFTLPFFTGLIIVPALFVTPGPPLLGLPFGLVITRTGAVSALFLLLRVSTSVSLTLLLILTTPWNTVLGAMSVLRVPDAFVLILGMTYRYIFLLLRAANDMFLSRQSRIVGRLGTSENQRILAAIAATLLGRSIDLSNEVYLSMQSRGFRGTPISLRPFRMTPRDWIWLAGLGLVAAAAIIFGQRTWTGV
jgi:cobalt/nickel transport system permease protein